jgi:hypothetical protein
VEAAIVFIPLMLIVFGIIEYGFVFKDSLTLSSATRAGARYGSAETGLESNLFFPKVADAVATAATAAQFKEGDRMWIYEAKEDGDPKDNTLCGNGVNGTWGTGSEFCRSYQYTGGRWNTAISNATGAWDSDTDVQACLGAGGTIDSVGVRLQLSHDAITGFFRDLQLKEKTVMRFEPEQSCG